MIAESITCYWYGEATPETEGNEANEGLGPLVVTNGLGGMDSLLQPIVVWNNAT